MRSEGLAQLLGGLGVERSFSRPRVSDDNAFSESHFKTLKYQPDYPERFPNGPPVARRPPASVAINPLLLEEAAPEVSASPLAAVVTSHEVVAPPATSSRSRRLARTRPERSGAGGAT